MAADVSRTEAKLEEITTLLAALDGNLKEKRLSTEECRSKLERLKVLGRDSTGSDPLFRKAGIETLIQYGLILEADEAYHDALRCVANALLLQPPTRQMLKELGYAPLLVNKLQNGSVDDEFLLSRILFLLTYDTDLDFTQLVTHNSLDTAIVQCLKRHDVALNCSLEEGVRPESAMGTMALSETLKLLFNITHHFSEIQSYFNAAIPFILHILIHMTPLPEPPLQPPVSYLVNALLNLDLASNSFNVFPSDDPISLVRRLIEILYLGSFGHPESELDTVAAPLLTLMRRMYEFAPNEVKIHMQESLLPSNDDRSQPLGKSDTLSGKLLRLSTSAQLPHLRDNISGLLFELSDKDPATFVRNVGYGYASGYLVNHNLQPPHPNTDVREEKSPVEEESSSTGASTTTRRPEDVNFVTGQYLADEAGGEEPPMTEEEKLREAERLFVLFERLKATGIVDVQNPVEAAAASGRLEEIEDTDSDDN